jgi:hypothetical protein
MSDMAVCKNDHFEDGGRVFIDSGIYRPTTHQVKQKVMTLQNPAFPVDTENIYDFSSPLWDRYFKATRKHVRFPRNYKEVSVFSAAADLEI